MRFRWNLFWSVSVAFYLLLGVSCGFRTKETATKLPAFSITNEIAGGEFRQILQVTNGLALYFTRSDVVVWFGEGSAISVEFDPENLRPLKILLKTPASRDQPAASVLDINADGVPEIREVKGESRRQVLYRGEWYSRKKEGTYSVITVGGKDVEVEYDGKRWEELHNRLER
jgi:hypothetical protein